MGRKKMLKLQRKSEKEQKTVTTKIKKKKMLIGIVFLVALLFAGYQISIVLKNGNNKQENPIVSETRINKGNIKLELYMKDVPRTVENFVTLANEDFYNGTKFHRVISDFMIQGGDPLSKDNDPSNDGTGGPGYKFEDEMNPVSLGLREETIKKYEEQGYKYDYNLNSYKVDVGSLAMANSGPNTNGSQFFIVTKKDQHHLNGKHTVFGRVVEGMDIVRSVEQGDVIEKVSCEKESSDKVNCYITVLLDH